MAVVPILMDRSQARPFQEPPFQPYLANPALSFTSASSPAPSTSYHNQQVYAPPIQAPPAKPYNPTTKPEPGQPLLHDGHVSGMIRHIFPSPLRTSLQILIFPETGHLKCLKCYDTGYRQNDPSNPCKSCWKRFGKPFNGPLKFAVTSTTANPSARQQPLPTFTSPARANLSTYPGLMNQHPAHGGFQNPQIANAYPDYGYDPNQSLNTPYRPGPPINPGYGHMGPSGPGASYPNILAAPGGMPPPNSLIVSPGDPRIGGSCVLLAVLARICRLISISVDCATSVEETVRFRLAVCSSSRRRHVGSVMVCLSKLYQCESS